MNVTFELILCKDKFALQKHLNTVASTLGRRIIFYKNFMAIKLPLHILLNGVAFFVCLFGLQSSYICLFRITIWN